MVPMAPSARTMRFAKTSRNSRARVIELIGNFRSFGAVWRAKSLGPTGIVAGDCTVTSGRPSVAIQTNGEVPPRIWNMECVPGGFSALLWWVDEPTISTAPTESSAEANPDPWTCADGHGFAAQPVGTKRDDHARDRQESGFGGRRGGRGRSHAGGTAAAA